MPEPRFGFELELEYHSTDYYAWRNTFGGPLALRSAWLTEPKSDGSLRNGVEFATGVQWTLAEWRAQPLTDQLTEAFDVGWRGDGRSRAGLHVHMDRAAFRDGAALYRFYQVAHADAVFLRLLSRRPLNGFRYCAPTWAWQHQPYIANEVLGSRPVVALGLSKYVAFRLHPFVPTVECRLFGSTLRATRLLAALEFVHALWQYTDDPTCEPTLVGWLTWVQDERASYPALTSALRDTWRRARRTQSVQLLPSTATLLQYGATALVAR